MLSEITDLGLYCCFSYLGPFWLVGLCSERRHNRLLRFHMNQGIVLFISELVLLLAAWIAGRIFGTIPVAGKILKFLFFAVAIVYSFLMSAIGMSRVLPVKYGGQPQPRELPVIGRIRILR